MNAQKLYKKLDEDFELDKMTDDWKGMEFNEYITDNFKKCYMGLMSDNTEEVNKVYTAVFPDEKILNKILESGEKDILLFLHHPMVWDISVSPVYKSINRRCLRKLRENRISIYSIHMPLDKNSPYSTSVSLARALGINPVGEFGQYLGVMPAVTGKTKSQTVEELARKAELTVGHKVKVWLYGLNEIKDGKVAVQAGGNIPEEITESAGLGINVFITGVTRQVNSYLPSLEFHKLAKEHNMNIIGATHYSTEKFACIAMVDYFKNLGLPAEFIEGKADLNDLE